MPDDVLTSFIEKHRLPDSFRRVAEEHYVPIANWLVTRHEVGQAMLLGINGAQGTGKSTLADFLALELREQHRWRVAVLSIDDFYLTHDERRELAAQVHPLLATRGVPGTHDVEMMSECIERLQTLRTGHTASLPRFDKSSDDRADPSQWPIVEGPIDVIILEGWCVGSMPQADDELIEPVNGLERDEDPEGTWRRHVNEWLASNYQPVFEKLDALVFLEAPGFDAILRWRTEQEHRLRQTSPEGSTIMDDASLRRFIQHYERITRNNLVTLPACADVLISLDDDHLVASSCIPD